MASHPTSAAVRALWQELNVRYFSDRLPGIAIVWSTRLTASAGLFVNRAGPRHPDPSPDRRCIKLSLPLLGTQPTHELLGTLAHEMIHQWQYDILKRRPNHGADFQRKLEAIERDGLVLSGTHRLDAMVEALSRYAWECTRCGCVYHRQRRTIRPRSHRCGRCSGPLREVRQRDGDGDGNGDGAKSPAGRGCRAASTSPSAAPLQLALPFV